MANGSGLTTFSLQALPWGSSVTRILHAALRAVEPGAALRSWMVRQGNILTVAGKEYPLLAYSRVLVVGVGKAAVAMGTALANILGSHITEGILLTKEGYAENLTGIKYLPYIKIFEAGHPIPDERGVRGAKLIADLLGGAGQNDLVVCLISGGGSALLTSPASDITLADLQAFTSTLLACGASINEINTLRKHLETLKGGGLARLAAPATVITLILSDVVGDPLDVIASGPSVPDPTTFADAYSVLERYRIVDKIPISIIYHLRCGMQDAIPDTPKPGETFFGSVLNVIVGSNRLAAEAGFQQAQSEGYNTTLLTTSMQGEASQVGRELGALAKKIATSGKPLPRPACIIAGGETTVTIHGNGKGGRNQELALAAVDALAGLKDTIFVTLATDGGDGPTDAAGAVITGETLSRARNIGLEPAEYLARNDSYHFFEQLGDLIKPGPTQTNVNDLALILVR